MDHKGFTLAEVVIVVIIIVFACVIGIGIFRSHTFSGNFISTGINGMTEIRCIEGFKFTVSQDGSSRQIMDENGKGIKCNPQKERK